MIKAKLSIATGLVVAISGCAYDQIGDVSYRSDGTTQHTLWGVDRPAPASFSESLVVPQDPRDKAAYDEKVSRQTDNGTAAENRSYYRKPTRQEISERTAMLMKMNAKVNERSPERARLADQVELHAASRTSHASARQVALSPLPGTSGVSSGLVDREPAKKMEQGAAIPSGRYQLVLDFDKSIPENALQTLLDIEEGEFSSRLVASGDRRVYLGGFNSEAQAKSMQSRFETDTGLTPQIRENQT